MRLLVTYWTLLDILSQPDMGLRFVQLGALELAYPACGQVSRQSD